MNNNDKLLIEQVNYLSHEDIDLAKELLQKAKSKKAKNHIKDRIKAFDILRKWKR